MKGEHLSTYLRGEYLPLVKRAKELGIGLAQALRTGLQAEIARAIQAPEAPLSPMQAIQLMRRTSVQYEASESRLLGAVLEQADGAIVGMPGMIKEFETYSGVLIPFAPMPLFRFYFEACKGLEYPALPASIDTHKECAGCKERERCVFFYGGQPYCGPCGEKLCREIEAARRKVVDKAMLNLLKATGQGQPSGGQGVEKVPATMQQ